MVAIKVLQHISFSTFILFLTYAVIILNHQRRLPINYYLSGLFFATGFQFFYYWAYSIGFLEFAPWLLNTEIAFGFLIGPFLYAYFCVITGAKAIRISRLLIQIIPFIVVTVGVVLVGFMDPSLVAEYRTGSNLFPNYESNAVIRVLNGLCDISLAVYFIGTLIRVAMVMELRRIGREFIVVFCFLILVAINVVILVVANAGSYDTLMIISLATFAALPMYYMFFSFRYPGFTIRVIREAKSLRYEKSILKNLDVELVMARMDELMYEEKIFRNDDLSLTSLSSRLKISPHQLSEILNERLGMNFRSYINGHRINEAKVLLVEEPDRSILNISLSVGFNTKSVFNSAFARQTGLSPTEFRNMGPEI